MFSVSVHYRLPKELTDVLVRVLYVIEPSCRCHRVCVCIYMYVCVCVYIYIYIYTHTHTHTHTLGSHFTTGLRSGIFGCKSNRRKTSTI